VKASWDSSPTAITTRVGAAASASTSGRSLLTAQERSDSSGSSREPSSPVGIPNAAGSGAAWAKYSSMNLPRHDVIAMNAAIPAFDPLASYASRTPPRARSAAPASGSTGMSGGSCAASVTTSLWMRCYERKRGHGAPAAREHLDEAGAERLDHRV
jgi:hypothetical protein